MPTDLEISTDPGRLDVDRVHAYLEGESYWAKGRPRELTELAIASSLAFGAYRDGRQVGFARLLTDGVALAWIADLFVFEEARGQGIGTALTQAILDHPSVAQVRRFALITLNAHDVYAAQGFTPLRSAEQWMERRGGGQQPQF